MRILIDERLPNSAIPCNLVITVQPHIKSANKFCLLFRVPWRHGTIKSRKIIKDKQ